MVDLAETPPVIAASPREDGELGRDRIVTAVVCILGLAFATSVLPFCAVDAARGPMMLELGWGANQLSLSYALMLWGSALSVWPIGVLIDRHGPKPVVMAGAVAISALCLLLPQVRHFWQFCAVFGLLGVCSSFGLGYAKILARLFDRRRGLAFGVFSAAGAALALFLPIVVGALVSQSGWRGAFAILGLAPLAVIPALGLGLAQPRAERVQKDLAVGVTAREAVRSRAFWLILAAGLAAALVSSAMVPALNDAMEHRGLGAMAQMRGAPAALLATLVGPILSGFALDRLRPRTVALGAYVGVAATYAIWALVTPSLGGRPLLMAGFAFGALMYSAQFPLTFFLFSRCFGLRAFATLCGLQAFIQAVVMGLVGPWIAGQGAVSAREAVVFAAGIAIQAVAGLLFLLLPNRLASSAPGATARKIPRLIAGAFARART